MRANAEIIDGFVRKEIINSPQGYLLKTKQGEREEYIHIYYRKGQRVRKRIKGDSEMTKRLLRKRLLETELEILEKNFKCVSAITDKYIEFSMNCAAARLPQRLAGDYQRLLEAEKQASGAGQNQSAYLPEGKLQITSRGLRVRSKSEVLIAEKLYECGIDFSYEEVLQIGKYTLAPDFTIRRRDGKMFYWEHCGRTGDI